MELCSYGCGRETKFYFKNGRGCCESSPNKCPIKRKKDSDNKKGKFVGTPAWKIDGFVYKPWNKGKTDVFSEESRKKISESLKGKSKGIGSTPEKESHRRQKISETMKNNPKSGGLRHGSGRGKKGWYKGYWCDSTWELAWVIYHTDHQITFERNKEFFTYEYLDKKRKYYPDFVIGDTYYEIKGRRSFHDIDDQNKEKIRQFKKNIVVLFEKDIKVFLDYVIDKYGKDFYTLYDIKEE
jgi:hypothetical protein